VLLLPFPLPALAQAAAQRTVTVKEGDTLEVIAGRHGVSVEALQKLNGITDPRTLQIDQVLKLPQATKPPAAKPAKAKPPAAKPAADKTKDKPAAKPAAEPTVKPTTKPAATPPAAQEPAPSTPQARPDQGRWRYFGNTLVDWGGWKLHPGGLRVTVVQPAAEDVGVVRAKATAVAVQCSSLRQTWRVDGAWQEWSVPEPRSVAQQIVLDLCDEIKAPDESAIPPPAAAPGP
jgi:LysM repeat protein